MGISRGFHSGVHVLDACLVGAVRQARARRKKKKKSKRRGFMDKQREGCCTVEEEGENSFFLLLNVQFGIGFFFFSFCFNMLYPSYCNCTNLHLFHVGFHLCSCPTLMLLLLRCFIYLFILFVVVLDDIHHYKTFFSS